MQENISAFGKFFVCFLSSRSSKLTNFMLHKIISLQLVKENDSNYKRLIEYCFFGFI